MRCRSCGSRMVTLYKIESNYGLEEIVAKCPKCGLVERRRPKYHMAELWWEP